MDDSGASRSAHCDGVTGKVGFCDGGKNAVLLVADVNEIDLPIAAEPVDDWIQRVANDAIAALDSGIRKHLP